MSKESYINELSDKLHISKKMLERYIYIVGTNEENIKDYALNSSCAIVRKDNGFDISYTAKMLNEKDQRIAELEEQLKNARKETAKKVIGRVEELGVFDFKVYEEMGFRRYIISQIALDNILKEYGETNG